MRLPLRLTLFFRRMAAFFRFFQHPFFYRKRTIVFIWAFLGVFTGVKQALTGHMPPFSNDNNYLLFINSYKHLAAHLNLYHYYPAETNDSYHYGPLFALLVAPFYWLPHVLSLTAWNVLNSLVLLYAIYQLPLSDRHRAIISWIILHNSYTCLLNTQFHHICAAMIILSYTMLVKKNEAGAAALVVSGMLIKLYGVVGLAFFPFAENKARYVLGLAGAFVVCVVLPMPFVGVDYTLQCYLDWYTSLVEKDALNLDPANVRSNVCVIGMVRHLTGNYGLSNLYFIGPGLLLLASAYLNLKQYTNTRFQLAILASVLLFLNLASTSFESPTFIISMPGAAIWYLISQQTTLDKWLIGFAIVLAGFAPSDLFPAYIRTHFVNQYALMVLPLLLIWLRLHYTLFTGSLLIEKSESQLVVS